MYHSNERIDEIAASLDAIKESGQTYFHNQKGMIPSRTDTVAIVTGLQSLMFPSYFV